MKSFHEAQNYLYSLVPPEGKTFPGQVGLDRMRRLVEALGNPHQKYPIIHVAGTSGKGSVCAILSAILTAAGYKTGLHMSPHVVSIKERMQVNNTMMSDQEFAHLVERVKPVIEQVSAESFGPVTYFEAILAIAFQHFADEKVDIAVVETGLGGTYDGTNVVDSVVSIITPIGYDHMQVLGSTLTEIAQNKAGIIKPSNRAVIVGMQKQESQEVIRQKVMSTSTPAIQEEKDFICTIKRLIVHGTVFNYVNKKWAINYKNLEVSLLGRHQGHNAGLAISAALELKHVGFEISEEAIRTGLREVKIPGRLEVIEMDPVSPSPQSSYAPTHSKDASLRVHSDRLLERRRITPVGVAPRARHPSIQKIILDGAHNEDKVKALAQALMELWPGRKFVLVFACKKNKDIGAMVKTLMPIIEKVYITEFRIGTDMGSKLSMPTDQIVGALSKVAFEGKVVVEPNPIEVLQKAIDTSAPEDVILVTGSLYLVSEVREYLIKTPDSLG